MKNKFFSVLMLSIIVFATRYIIADAKTANTDLTTFNDFYDEKEAAEIISIISQSPMFDRSKELDAKDIQYIKNGDLSIYKTHRIITVDPISLFGSKEDLSNIIPKDYYWKAVTPTKVVITVTRQKDGDWSVAGYGKKAASENILDTIQNNSLEAILSKLDIVDMLLVFEVPQVFTDFAFIKVSGAEYLIPFGARPDLTGLENGKIYDKEGIAKALISSGWEGKYESGEAKNPNLNGGALAVGDSSDTSNITQENTINFLIPKVVLVIMALVIAYLFFLKKESSIRDKT